MELDIANGDATPGLAHTPTNTSLLVSLRNVRFNWPGQEHDVLNIEEFFLREGERVFLQGASGSGKTTLLSLLGGVISPQSGTIRILDKDVTGMGHAARDKFRADHIGFVFQQFNLIPYLSLVDNVTLPCRFSRLRRDRAVSKAATVDAEAGRLLEHLGLDVSVLGSRPVTDLSVGQQQRVAVARALIGSPELIIADEPTSALDVEARFAFLDLLFREVKESGATLLFVSHDPALQSRFERSVRLSEINSASCHMGEGI
ncbi:ABC transporter ATP-binding protein [Hahella sp. CCB-MM4]|uniref:ABC transporter ATP-binding protein n=1 Tax=Hahella sp. (strain CCB-MM4) TaxID=1926491 RepID=UPI000B9ABBFF|nr:ABC transporter ATP-binding protein [Hahella sp. CCB-MM4]